MHRWLFCVFLGAKAFVLERTNTPLNIYQKSVVQRGKKRIEKNGDCTTGVGAKLCRDY